MIKKIVIMLFGSLLLAAQIGICESINWNPYTKGMQKAKAENKKTFLHFRADWCGYCKQMDKTTFKDREVIQFLNTHYISIKVDGDREKKIGKAYKVTGYPDNRFLDEEGRQAYRLSGFIAPEQFQFFLEYIESGSYKTMSPMEYFKAR